MRILVTGSSSGIGRALIEHLAAAGHEVWGLARSQQAEPRSPAPGRFRSSRCDVSNWNSVLQCSEVMAREWPHLDAIVACAGIHGAVGRTLATDPRAWAETVVVNLTGTYHTLRAYDALLSRAPRRAKVICFSGGGATKARPNFSAYGAAKTGVVRLVETIAEEERGRALDINAVAPGAINTRLTQEIITLGSAAAGSAEYESALRQQQSGDAPLQKAIALVDWLLSPASDGISGRLISAPWDPWPALGAKAQQLAATDIYMLRRITPPDRQIEL